MRNPAHRKPSSGASCSWVGAGRPWSAEAGWIGVTLGVLVAANVLAHRVVPRASAVVAAGKVAGLSLIARSAGLTAAELGLDRKARGAGVRWGAGSAALVAGGYAAVLAVPAARAVIPSSGPSSAVSLPRAVVRAFAVIPLTTVLPEEYAFRGVLIGLLTRRFGPLRALVLSSALFGLWHVLPGLAGAGAANESLDRVVGSGKVGTWRVGAALRVGGTVLVTTVGGLWLGSIRQRSGSLLAPVLLHWAINGLGELVAGGTSPVLLERNRG